MKKVFYIMILTIIVCLFSCKSSNNIVDNTIMQYEFDTIVNKQFVDSVIASDTLEFYPNEWIYSPLIDYTTNKNISTRTYYKEYQESVYKIIEENDSLYKFSKRVKK